MRKPSLALALAAALPLVACGAPSTVDSVKLITRSEDAIVLRGLVDATRNTPPERFDRRAAELCGQSGRVAKFRERTQRSTAAFDLTYDCIPSGN